MSVWRRRRAQRTRPDLGDLRRTTPIELHWGRSRGGPIDRLYVEEFLERHHEDITGHVMEVGDAGYTQRYGQGVARVDVLDIDPANAQATIVADITELAGVPSDTFDCIVLTQVLQLVFDVRSAMHALATVLSPGGVLLATFPGILRTAPEKPDYWRFTALSVEALANEAFPGGEIVVETFGNVLAAAAFLYGLGQDDVDRAELAVHDPAFEVTIGLRAVKPGGSS